ncbi:hypothetical protein RUM44_011807 [Polyplax serrata]|uniref:Golgi membrane protein 1 n=1 Tax=Polyplax serrata TaxID=468196 RepID=A0ABR1AST8_POLSC
MGIDLVRGSNPKCPSFLLCGLSVMCFFLLCNWWSLSSQNFELLKQIDNLAEQLRVNGEELGKCSQQQILLEEKLKDSQTKFVQQQIKIEQIKETEDDVKEGYEKIQDELNTIKKKCDSTEKKLNVCNAEKDSLDKISKSKMQDISILNLEKKQLQVEIDAKSEMIKQLTEEAKYSNVKPLVKSRITTGGVVQESYNRNNMKTNKENFNSKSSIPNSRDQIFVDSANEKDDTKNDGDTTLIPPESDDPREQAMKGN